jgi:hypothetical protein
MEVWKKPINVGGEKVPSVKVGSSATVGLAGIKRNMV